MRHYVADNFDSIFRDLVTDLLYARESRPRGQRIREQLVPTLQLTNPRARLLSSPARDANYRFATGEFFWYLRGARDVESVAYYNPRMRQWSDDGVTLNSAYGAILIPQWRGLIDVLRADPDSRRAVATIYTSDYLTRETKDVPCTSTLQFLIRDGRLHLHVTMRSNDVIWGLTNDLFSFTLLQETFLIVMRKYFPGLELGDYYHTAGSMHLYERHFVMAEEISNETRVGVSTPMLPLDGRGIQRLLRGDEAWLRLNPGSCLNELAYHGGVRWMVAKLNEHRALVDARAATTVTS
jgi:thymidylate synthase